MKFLFLLLLFITISNALKAQRGCSDSSFHIRYKSQYGLFVTIKQIATDDKGTVVIGSIGSNKPHTIIYKKDSTENILWSKVIDIVSPYLNLTPYAVTEAGNGNIAVIGLLSANNNNYFYKVIFSSTGTLLRQDIFAASNNISIDNAGVHTVRRYSADSLMFICYYDNYILNGASNQGLFISVTDNNGATGRTIFLAIHGSPNLNIGFAAAKVYGNKLKLFGLGFSFACDHITNEGTFASLQFDIAANKVDYLKSYCLPKSYLVANQQALWNSVFETSDVFFLENGTVAIARRHIGIQAKPPYIYSPMFIAYFDSSFTPVYSNYLRSARQFPSNKMYDLLIEPDGTMHFNLTDGETKNVYYARADNNGRFLLQKKMSLPASVWRLGNTLGTQVVKQGKFAGTVFNTYANNQTYIDYLQIRQADINEECFGTDTSFLSFIPADMSLITPNPVTVIQTGVITAPVNFPVSDYPIIREDICIIKEICDTLKLTSPGIVCNVTEPVLITAFKNPLCRGKINFIFDTAAAQSYTQINDTTLSLRFNKNYRGKIFAQPSSCDKLIDSVEIVVTAPLPPINLGSDTAYCPGHSYLLNAQNAAFNSYTWQDGSTNSSFTATTPGKYYVSATDDCSRVYTDTINIIDKNISLHIEKDTVICLSEPVVLQATANFINYTWMPEGDMTRLAGNRISVEPRVTTSYSVKAEKFTGCFLSDTVLVKVENCPQYIYFPNSFTPNNDNLNDHFKPLVGGAIKKYELNIYNRWGNLVFRTTSKEQGWNGFYRGILQETGSFVWVCNYQYYNKPEMQKKGSLVLIR